MAKVTLTFLLKKWLSFYNWSSLKTKEVLTYSMRNSPKNGWVRFYRKSFDSTVWLKPVTWYVWSWCLLKANHQKTKFPFNGEDIELREGQFISGRSSALRELPGLTPQQWRTAIFYLKSTSRITTQSNNRFSVFTIINWELYQTDNQLVNQPVTNKQPASNQPVTIYKNDKKEKNEKKIQASQSDAGLIIELISSFEGVNPSFKRWYGNPTQRGACDRLIVAYGLEKLRRVVVLLKKTNGMRFFPTITTPVQLEDKWAQLELALIRKKSEGESKQQLFI